MQEVKRTPQQDYTIREYDWADTVYKEQIIMCSEKLLEKYLDGGKVEAEELEACLKVPRGKRAAVSGLCRFCPEGSGN